MHAFFQFLAICLGLAMAMMIAIATATFGLLLVFRPQPGTVVFERPGLAAKTSDQTETWDPMAEADLRYFLDNGKWPDDQPPKSPSPSIYAMSTRPVDPSPEPGASIRGNLRRIAREQQARLAESQQRYKELTRRADQMESQTQPRPSIGASSPSTDGRRRQSSRGGGGRHGGRRAGMR